jgi:hypothetical protein
VKLKYALPLLLIIPIIVLIYFNSLRIADTQRRNVLEKAFSKPLYLNLEDSSRSITLKDIGITYDKVKDDVNINTFKLNAYLSELEKEYEFLSKNTIISFEDFSFRAPSEHAQIKLDRTPFSSKEIIMQLVSSPVMKMRLTLDTKDDLNIQTTKTDELIEKISTPLLIKYGRNPIYIPKDTIKGFIDIKEHDGLLTGFIDFDAVSKYLSELDKRYASTDLVVIHKEAADAIRRAILFRAADYQVNNAVILPLEGLPKTNGELHDVYLEVIKSQQRLYRFEHGKLVKTYIISTGLTLETPPGNYKILGKDKMTISYTGNWYMPNYLPIGYINGQLRFGFHAIPYHMDGAGNIFSRDPNTMGSPATGGCIQLVPADSEELFNWAWIGMPVYVYE